jgi:hypothetical protein
MFRITPGNVSARPGPGQALIPENSHPFLNHGWTQIDADEKEDGLLRENRSISPPISRVSWFTLLAGESSSRLNLFHGFYEMWDWTLQGNGNGRELLC